MCHMTRRQLMLYWRKWSSIVCSSETFNKFYAELRNVVKSCEFGLTEEKLLKTQIVLNIWNKDVQSKFLRGNLSIEKIVRQCMLTNSLQLSIWSKQWPIPRLCHLYSLAKYHFRF